jgi:hypothetical protein
MAPNTSLRPGAGSGCFPHNGFPAKITSAGKPTHCKEEAMNSVIKVAAAGLVVATAVPVFAENLEALKPGEAIAVMPDGRMARTIVTDPKKIEELKKNSKEINFCSMLMAGADGEVYLVNTAPHNPMVICEDMLPR